MMSLIKISYNLIINFYNYITMENRIWSFGEKFEKTPKSQKPILNDKNEIITNIINRAEYNIKKKLKIDNFRENEIMQREMLVRDCQNPFLNIKHGEIVDIQDEFLMPKNSIFEKFN